MKYHSECMIMMHVRGLVYIMKIYVRSCKFESMGRMLLCRN